MTDYGGWAPPPPPEQRPYAGVVPASGPSAIICPYCQAQGSVTVRRVKKKRGVSGAKAAGAVLTAGFSVFATGLSRKETLTEMRCGNCHTKWLV